MVNIQFCCIIWIVENNVVFDKHNLHQGHCVFGSVCRHVCHHSVSKHEKKKDPISSYIWSLTCPSRSIDLVKVIIMLYRAIENYVLYCYCLYWRHICIQEMSYEGSNLDIWPLLQSQIRYNFHKMSFIFKTMLEIPLSLFVLINDCGIWKFLISHCSLHPNIWSHLPSDLAFIFHICPFFPS